MFSHWQILLAKQWAKWTCTTTRDSSMGEDEAGGSEDDSEKEKDLLTETKSLSCESDSELNFETTETETPIRSPLRESCDSSWGLAEPEAGPQESLEADEQLVAKVIEKCSPDACSGSSENEAPGVTIDPYLIMYVKDKEEYHVSRMSVVVKPFSRETRYFPDDLAALGIKAGDELDQNVNPSVLRGSRAQRSPLNIKEASGFHSNGTIDSGVELQEGSSDSPLKLEDDFTEDGENVEARSALPKQPGRKPSNKLAPSTQKDGFSKPEDVELSADPTVQDTSLTQTFPKLEDEAAVMSQISDIPNGDGQATDEEKLVSTLCAQKSAGTKVEGIEKEPCQKVEKEELAVHGLLESSSVKAPVSVACGDESPLDEICLREADNTALVTLLREEIITKEIEANIWKKKYEESREEVLEMRKIVTEYEKTISQMIENQQSTSKSCQKAFQQLNMEKEQALADLSSVETSLSGLFRRYENLKGVLEGFKKNEEALKHCAENYLARIKLEEQRYQILKVYAKEKLDRANEEIAQIRSKAQAESDALHAGLLKEQRKVESLERALKKKNQEAEELTKICEEEQRKVESLGRALEKKNQEAEELTKICEELIAKLDKTY
ncbi:transforming acidic coiled-coil-containing protein 1-like [Mus caroli]|uniref:Transforming acidic coiled-coil-containing protein 1-like n=1 Tax=Mus caroli TaxID=10089 RepID=A0A6P5NZC5_MUSCR|nr:transforming acidic coiled-coil-containing protein 1-like [Mus caroli]